MFGARDEDTLGHEVGYRSLLEQTLLDAMTPGEHVELLYEIADRLRGNYPREFLQKIDDLVESFKSDLAIDDRVTVGTLGEGKVVGVRGNPRWGNGREAKRHRGARPYGVLFEDGYRDWFPRREVRKLPPT